MGNLSGKRALVTGASTGIGRATAMRIASEGARVALFDINDVDAESALRTIQDSGGDARYWRVDVTEEREVGSGVDEAADWLGGGIDVLAHLAGILKGSGLEVTDVDSSIWDPVIEVNLKGSYIVVKHVARYMIPERSGVIILTSLGRRGDRRKLVGGLRSQQGRNSRPGYDAGRAPVQARHQGERHTARKPGYAIEGWRDRGAACQHRRPREVRQHNGRAVITRRRRLGHRVPRVGRRRLRSGQHQDNLGFREIPGFGYHCTNIGMTTWVYL